MATAVSCRDVGVRFRMWRRNRAGHRAPRVPWGHRWHLWGLRHVDLDVAAGEVVGLIGPNGAGKTTLLMTIASLYRPDEGSVEVNGRVAPLLSPGAGLLGGLSGRANLELAGVLLGLSRREATELVPVMVEFSGLGDFIDAPVRTYSAGMRARLGFALAVHCRPDILLLDEVMAVGDQDFRDRSRDRIGVLRAQGCTIVLASHELAGLTAMADRVVHLDEGAVVQEGDPREVVDRYIAEHGHGPPRGRRTPGL